MLWHNPRIKTTASKVELAEGTHTSLMSVRRVPREAFPRTCMTSAWSSCCGKPVLAAETAALAELVKSDTSGASSLCKCAAMAATEG